MEFQPIVKDPKNWPLPPNLLDYEKMYAAFSWDQIHA